MAWLLTYTAAVWSSGADVEINHITTKVSWFCYKDKSLLAKNVQSL